MRQKHVLVNERVVNIPSLQVRVGDVLAIKDKSRQLGLFSLAGDLHAKRPTLSWCETDRANMCGKIKAMPVREELGINVKERLVVELYSK